MMFSHKSLLHWFSSVMGWELVTQFAQNIW